MPRALVVWLFVATLPLDTRAVRVHEPEVVRIPAGDVTMGADAAMISEAVARCRAETPGLSEAACAPEAWVLGELPAHRVHVSAFGLGLTEVTREEYDRCVVANVCAPARAFPGDPRLEGARVPVVGISWHDAARYCAFAGGRLPTEAEWERAARGEHGRLYPWGDAWDPRRANHGKLDGGTDGVDGWDGLAPVDALPADASPFGVLGMAGNAREWVSDVWDENAYAHARHLDPRGPAGGGVRVVRGGSFATSSIQARASARGSAGEGHRSFEIGVRCAYDSR